MDYTYSTFYPNQALQESNAIGSSNVGVAPSQNMGESNTASTPSTPISVNSPEYGLEKWIVYDRTIKCPSIIFTPNIQAVPNISTNETASTTATAISEIYGVRPYYKECKESLMSKVWLDGTNQEGKIIATNGKIVNGYDELSAKQINDLINNNQSYGTNTTQQLKDILKQINLFPFPQEPIKPDTTLVNNSTNVDITAKYLKALETYQSIVNQIVKIPKYIDYSKTIGFTKTDGKGNYFYFEPLPEYKMAEIGNLVRLKKEKEDAEAKAKVLAQKEAREKAQKAKEAFERARQEAKAKREAEEQAKRQAAELARQQEMQRIAAKEKTNKTMYMIITIVAIGIIGFFVWRKMKK